MALTFCLNPDASLSSYSLDLPWWAHSEGGPRCPLGSVAEDDREVLVWNSGAAPRAWRGCAEGGGRSRSAGFTTVRPCGDVTPTPTADPAAACPLPATALGRSLSPPNPPSTRLRPAPSASFGPAQSHVGVSFQGKSNGLTTERDPRGDTLLSAHGRQPACRR